MKQFCAEVVHYKLVKMNGEANSVSRTRRLLQEGSLMVCWKYKPLGGFEERHGPVCAYRRNKGTFYSELLTFHISEALEALSKKRLIEVFRRKTKCIVH